MYSDVETTTQTPRPGNPNTDTESGINTTAPGQLRVIKRNGTVVPYHQEKIAIAMTKAFLAVEGGTAAASRRVHETVEKLSSQITATFKRRMPSGGTIHIEEIQDQVELILMRTGEHKIARDYVIYRTERARLRTKKSKMAEEMEFPRIQVVMPGGEKRPLDIERLTTLVTEACEGLEEVEPQVILKEAMRNLYDGVSYTDLNTSMVISARTLVEKEPNYTYATARLLMDKLRSEALSFLDVAETATQHQMEGLYAPALKSFMSKGVELERLSPELLTFDLDRLGKALKAERDTQFTYLGLQTLYDRYFIHSDNIRYELPQIFFMRVAMGLSILEDDKNARAIEFYDLLSSFDYMSSTPTLFNAGTLRAQLSSCYLTSIPDDLTGIYGAIQDNAMLSKWAGGLGNDWTPVRALGSYIKGTNGKSQGVVPFLKVANDTAVAVNQGGKRKGAVCAYLESWHLDIEEFLELRKNTGDDRRRTHDMNTANWIPDLFMKRVFEDQSWTLFSPNDAPDLHDLFGKAFETRYAEYEQMAAEGKIKLFKKVRALDLWRKMLSMLFETGHPWLTWKDPSNLRSPQDHAGVVHNSNLCTEILLNTSRDETAVCNLGSVNLALHITDGKLDETKLQKTVRTAIRMLDNVIDINFYPTKAAETSAWTTYRRLLGHTINYRPLLIVAMVGMVIEGIFTWAMLAYGGLVIGVGTVPMAALLGLITGLLAFIPNIGALISGLLMVLVGFSGGTDMGIYTIFVYFIVQTIDGYVLIPMIARKTVDLAPALVLAAQLIMGVLFGILGLALADPLLAMTKVALERRAEQNDAADAADAGAEPLGG